jgi:hypothetical protein
MNPALWTDAEKAKLQSLWERGIRNYVRLGREIGRSPKSVEGQRIRMGLKVDNPPRQSPAPRKTERYFNPAPLEDGELLLRKRAARSASQNLADAILAAFPYGTGELPSVAKSTYNWQRRRQPTLVSNGSSMT